MIKPIYVCGPKVDVGRLQDFIYKNFADEFKLKPDMFVIHHAPFTVPEDAQHIYVIKSLTDEDKWMEFYYLSINKGYTPILVEDF